MKTTFTMKKIWILVSLALVLIIGLAVLPGQSRGTGNKDIVGTWEGLNGLLMLRVERDGTIVSSLDKGQTGPLTSTYFDKSTFTFVYAYEGGSRKSVYKYSIENNGEALYIISQQTIEYDSYGNELRRGTEWNMGYMTHRLK